MTGVAVVLLLSGGWLLALLAVGWAAGRICGLNDRLPPPRRWVADSGRTDTTRVVHPRSGVVPPVRSGQNPSGRVADRRPLGHMSRTVVPSGETRAHPPRRAVEADTPGRHSLSVHTSTEEHRP